MIFGEFFSSVNNTLNKNDVEISEKLSSDINEIINISQLVLTTIAFLITLPEKNKKNIKDKEQLKKNKVSVSAFNKSMYDNFYTDYIFNENTI